LSQQLDASTVTTTTVELKDGGANNVTRTVTWDAASTCIVIDPTGVLDYGEIHTVTVKSGASGVKNLGGLSMDADYVFSFTVESDPGPPPSGIMLTGYAVDAGATGGPVSGGGSAANPLVASGGATTHVCTTWAQFKTALLRSDKRLIQLSGSTNFNGGNDSFDIDNGNFTVDGTNYTGVIYNCKMVHTDTCDNVVYYNVAIRPGEGNDQGASGDRRAITFNGTNTVGARVGRILIDQCSFAFGPDVVMSLINNSEDATISNCIIGPCMYDSNISSHPNGYGPNITTPGNSTPATIYVKRVTYYKNLIVMNHQRNLKAEHGDFIEFVNNAVYDWGTMMGHGNPRGISIVGNVFKKGPQTRSSNEVWEPDSNYAQYASSIYLPLSGTQANIGLTSAGGSFTPTKNVQGAASLSSVYATLKVTASQASSGLYTTIVNSAGRQPEDAFDAAVKIHALAGTDEGDANAHRSSGQKAPGFNGPSVNSAPPYAQVPPTTLT
jgi:hypothetical protein